MCGRIGHGRRNGHDHECNYRKHFGPKKGGKKEEENLRKIPNILNKIAKIRLV